MLKPGIFGTLIFEQVDTRKPKVFLPHSVLFEEITFSVTFDQNRFLRSVKIREVSPLILSEFNGINSSPPEIIIKPKAFLTISMGI